MFVSAVVLNAATLAIAAPRAGKSSAVAKQKDVTGDSKPKAFFILYTDQASMYNHFAPSGWMGDTNDLKMNQGSSDNPKTGKTCLELTYNAKASQGAGWSGIFWQHPPNNWGVKKGYVLTGAKKLTFWARGLIGGEKVAEFKVGGITGEVPDSDAASLGPVELTKDWKQYTIDLEGKDLSNICGGFAIAIAKDDNANGAKIFIDEIVFE